MNKILKVAAATILLCMVASCKQSIYSGFEKMESGAYMKFYVSGDSDQMPRLGDAVTVEMAQYFDDSLLLTTAGDRPLELRVEEASFVGDVPDGLRMMHVGDSARLVVLIDSVFITMMNSVAPPEYAGKPVYYDLKLLAIKTFEEIEAERKAMLDSLNTVENDYLIGLQADKKNTVTESGLIVMEKKGKGRLAQLGDFINFDFAMCSKDGDTLASSFGQEPLEFQFGEEFICRGFNEALGMVPAGGSMHFVIPSELAFDSVGYQGMILPYTPLVGTIKMNSIIDKETYAKQQAELAAQQQAERERLLALEKQRIADYVAANGITVKPTESGLYIIRLQEGQGEVARLHDEVRVHYVLKNLNGEQVESSYDHLEPLEFMLGQNEMIPAIEEALLTMAPGAKVTLITPSELAFGEYVIDENLLPAYSPLLIDLELVEVKANE